MFILMLGRQQEQECFKCSAAFEEIQLKTKCTILWPESGFFKGDFILIHFDIQDFRCISDRKLAAAALTLCTERTHSE